ncbi:MAG TPA: carboxypeptidase-like regulatory domain-containing protein, partial [Bacteroidales bacterium]|nr:carboxypeptidase-like regulatory domain-containing protein [Bacteroidales bacterium]
MALTSRISLPHLAVIIFTLCGVQLNAQYLRIRGIVADTSGIAIPYASVFSPAYQKGTITGTDGRFSLDLTAGRESPMILVSSIGYITDTLFVNSGNEEKDLKVILRNEVVKIDGVNVFAPGGSHNDFLYVPVAASAVIPSVSGGIEAVVVTMPGVASFSELSYQYSVRGGSYDENLIYINDIEIYRPYLVRTGQQEGLSQINPDLVASVRFSPGGFNATYGDRMSSVLDIHYRKPEYDEASLSLSMLTSSAHVGLTSNNGKFYLLSGIRYRSNAILLRSSDATSQYKPLFTDIQAIAGYKTGPGSQLTLTMSASSNRYIFAPESQTTTFGSVTAAYKLFAYFEGGERDKYDNLNGALTYSIIHNEKLNSRIIISGHLGSEKENFDIRGAYNLRALDETTGSENNPDSLMHIGVGSWLSHARNSLKSDIASVSYRGSLNTAYNLTEWGVTG